MSTKKPWEYGELAVEHGHGSGRGDRWLYTGPDQEIGVVSAEAPGGADVWATFFMGSPAMARELRMLVRLLEPLEASGTLDVPGLATLNGARAALRNAGVLK